MVGSFSFSFFFFFCHSEWQVEDRHLGKEIRPCATWKGSFTNELNKRNAGLEQKHTEEMLRLFEEHN